MFLKHGNSLLLNQEIKNKQQLKIKEPGLWEMQDGHLAFPSSLMDLILWALIHIILSSSFVN